jgi:hypothetical protein
LGVIECGHYRNLIWRKQKCDGHGFQGLSDTIAKAGIIRFGALNASSNNLDHRGQRWALWAQIPSDVNSVHPVPVSSNSCQHRFLLSVPLIPLAISPPEVLYKSLRS